VPQLHEPHFFVDRSQIQNDTVLIEGADARHLARVRRARAGDLLRLSDGAGVVAEAKVSSVDDGVVRCEVVGRHQFAPNRPRVTICQGLAKGSKVDLAVQKLVELGVDDVVVFTAGRSVPDWDDRRRAEALARWSSIALEAAKQSRRAWLPTIKGPLGLEEAAAIASEAEFAALADQRGTPLSKTLSGIDPGSVAGIVGPEGGLNDEEVAAFEKRGVQVVSLGLQVLRSETASLALATILMFHFGLLG
jgi:16S rRNA (uracil1498-N3)-methyltransferase